MTRLDAWTTRILLVYSSMLIDPCRLGKYVATFSLLSLSVSALEPSKFKDPSDLSPFEGCITKTESIHRAAIKPNQFEFEHA